MQWLFAGMATAVVTVSLFELIYGQGGKRNGTIDVILYGVLSRIKHL